MMNNTNEGNQPSDEAEQKNVEEKKSKILSKVINTAEKALGVDIPEKFEKTITERGDKLLSETEKKIKSGEILIHTAKDLLNSADIQTIASKLSQANLIDVWKNSEPNELNELAPNLLKMPAFNNILQRCQQLEIEKNIRINRNDTAILKNLYELKEDPEKLQEYLNKKGKDGQLGKTLKKIAKIGRENIRLPPDFQELPRQNIFLGEIVARGLFGKLFPLILMGIFIGLGFLNETYNLSLIQKIPEIFKNSTTTYAEVVSYTYWVVFLGIGTIVLSLFASGINNTLRLMHRKIDINQKTAEKWQTLLLGWPAEISIIAISAVVVYFDLQNFERLIGISLDSWNLDTYIWVSILAISWMYFISFVWLAFGFLLVCFQELRKTQWRSGIENVIENKEYRSLLNTIILVYLPLVPYIFLKIVFQLFFIPSTTDLVVTFILVGLFFLGIIGGPIIVAQDVKIERKALLEPVQRKGKDFIRSTFEKVINNEKVQSSDVMKALMVQLNSQNIKDTLKEKIIDSELVKKMIAMVSGPALAYVSQLFKGDSFLNMIFDFLF